MQVLSIQEVYTKNKENETNRYYEDAYERLRKLRFICTIKSSPSIQDFKKGFFIDTEKNYIFLKTFVAEIEQFLFSFKHIGTLDSFESIFENYAHRFNKVTFSRDRKIFPKIFDEKYLNMESNLIGFVPGNISVFKNDTLEFFSTFISKLQEQWSENEKEFFNKMFYEYMRLNAEDWDIRLYDPTISDRYIERARGLPFEQFSRYALDLKDQGKSGLNGDVLYEIGSFLGPVQKKIGLEINKDPRGVFSTRNPILLIENKNIESSDLNTDTKRQKLNGGKKQKRSKRRSKY